jgi:hypothetical protein
LADERATNPSPSASAAASAIVQRAIREIRCRSDCIVEYLPLRTLAPTQNVGAATVL